MKLGVNLINFGPSAGPDVFQQWVRVVGRRREGVGGYQDYDEKWL